jgi:hypothetical protein
MFERHKGGKEARRPMIMIGPKGRESFYSVFAIYFGDNLLFIAKSFLTTTAAEKLNNLQRI